MFVDATYCKARVGRQVVSQAIVVAIGVAVVVDTDDVLLITSRSHAQDVKKAVESLKARGADDVL